MLIPEWAQTLCMETGSPQMRFFSFVSPFPSVDYHNMETVKPNGNLFSQLLCRTSHVARLLLVKIIHVETILESTQEFKKS